MRVAVWIDHSIYPQKGGAASYYYKLVRGIDEYDFSSELDVCFVGKMPLKQKFNKSFILLKSSDDFLLNTMLKLSRVFRLPFSIIKILQDKITFNENLGFQKQLSNQGVDVVYYMNQMQCEVQNFPFIATNWDLGHLTIPAFPEITLNQMFEYRNKWYSEILPKALAVFVESVSSKQEFVKYLPQINVDKLFVVPLFAGDVVSDELEDLNFLQKHDLEPSKFFFYPAQFWAHKNHYNLVKAFKIVHNANPDLKLVFTGSDKGNENYIRELVSELGLDTKVLFLGFVSNLELKTLYKKAISLVMPTFLGPTNMPLLEARSLGCPIVCSDLDGHREQLGEGALYFDHRSYSDIASKMMEILDNGLRNNQIAVANEIEKTSVFNLGSAIESVNKNLMSVSKIRKIWGKNNRIF